MEKEKHPVVVSLRQDVLLWLGSQGKRVKNVFLVVLIKPIIGCRDRIFAVIHGENSISGSSLGIWHGCCRKYIGQPAVDRGGVIAANAAQIAENDLRQTVCLTAEI